jgi:hypothetical protein
MSCGQGVAPVAKYGLLVKLDIYMIHLHHFTAASDYRWQVAFFAKANRLWHAAAQHTLPV